jgi:pimeloyl-ACP methyl ester carboxylesterase
VDGEDPFRRPGRPSTGCAQAAASADREAEDVARVIDAIVEPIRLLGHSYGGIVALKAAVRSRQLRSLALYERRSASTNYRKSLPRRSITGSPGSGVHVRV